jgi:hypothetical protein
MGQKEELERERNEAIRNIKRKEKKEERESQKV